MTETVVWTSTSRLRMWTSSWATIPSTSAGKCAAVRSSGADGKGRAARPPAGCKGPRMGVRQQVEARALDADASRQPLDGRLEEWRFGRGKLAGTYHPRRDSVEVPVGAAAARSTQKTEIDAGR